MEKYPIHQALKIKTALTGVAQWAECHPANQKVARPTPGQGACLDCRPGPQLGACQKQPTQIDVSLVH